MKLSQERAEAVRAYLIVKGVARAPERRRASARRSRSPTTSTAAGREANRRVEFHIVDEPTKKPKPGAPAAEPAPEGEGDGA